MCNKQTRNFATCPRCRRRVGVTNVFIASNYDGYVKELISRFKYKHATDIAGPLAGLLPVVIKGEFDCLIPVPSSSRRFRQRGYNPAALLARQLSRDLNVPCCDMLGRLGQSRQVGAKRQERLRQLEGQVFMRRQENIDGKHVLLVDDVVTTGTTVAECAKVLKGHGAKTVAAAVIAKH